MAVTFDSNTIMWIGLGLLFGVAIGVALYTVFLRSKKQMASQIIEQAKREAEKIRRDSHYKLKTEIQQNSCSYNLCKSIIWFQDPLV